MAATDKTVLEPGKTPLEQTKEFETELTRDEASAAADAKKLDGLRQDLAVLQASLSDLESASAGYEKIWKDLKKRKTDLEGFHSLQKERFKGLAKADEVSKKIDDFDDRVARKTERISELNGNVATAEKDVQEASKELENAQAVFKKLKDTQAHLEATLKEAEDLKGRLDVQASDAKGYLMLRELERLLKDVQVESKENFKNSFDSAFEKSKEAMQSVRKTTAELEKLKAELDKANGELKDLTENRQAKLLNALSAK